MLAPTHSIFGLFLTLTLLAIFGIKLSLHWSILVCAILGSLMPDIDLQKSFIGRLFPFISKPLERKFGHRTITHSLIGWLIATVILGIFLSILAIIVQTRLIVSLSSFNYFNFFPRWLAAFSIGYFSHLILDMFNPRGSQLFWPNKSRDVIPKDVNFRPEVGSKSELVIFIFLFICLIMALPLSQYGLSSSLRWLLGTPQAAIAQFQNQKTRMFVEFKGVYTATHQPVSGVAEVLGVKNKRLIVYFKSESQNLNLIYTMSDELTADILAQTVRFKETDLPIIQKKIIFEDKERDSLLALIPTDSVVTGKVELPIDLKIIFPPTKNPNSSYKTMSQTVDTLILDCASKAEIASLQLDESFKIREDQDQAEKQRLYAEIQSVKSQLKNLDSENANLTPLGKKIFAKEEDTTKKAELLARLNSLDVLLRELDLKIKKRKFRFSGDVDLRLI